MFLSELDAVNFIRGSIGASPVSTLTTDNPDVIAAKNRLDNTTTEVQARGWWFNREVALTLAADGNGEIVIPGTTISAIPEDPFTYLTTRGSRVYDPINHTFNIGESVNFTVVERLAYEDLPYVAANHIQYVAARKFQADFDGDPARVQDLRSDAEVARIDLNREETKARPKNALLSAGSLRMFRRVSPQTRFTRTGRNPTIPGG